MTPFLLSAGLLANSAVDNEWLRQLVVRESEDMGMFFETVFVSLRALFLTNSKPYKKHIELSATSLQPASGSAAFNWFRNRWIAALRRYAPAYDPKPGAPGLAGVFDRMGVFTAKFL